MTPFEIRLELIKLAHLSLSEQYNANNNRWLLQTGQTRHHEDFRDLPDYKIDTPPTFPEIETIVQQAEILNRFVSENKPFKPSVGSKVELESSRPAYKKIESASFPVSTQPTYNGASINTNGNVSITTQTDIELLEAIKNAPERRVFSVDVGEMTPTQGERILKKIKNDMDHAIEVNDQLAAKKERGPINEDELFPSADEVKKYLTDLIPPNSVAAPTDNTYVPTEYDLKHPDVAECKKILHRLNHAEEIGEKATQAIIEANSEIAPHIKPELIHEFDLATRRAYPETEEETKDINDHLVKLEWPDCDSTRAHVLKIIRENGRKVSQ